MNWLDLCNLDDLVPNSGVCALVGDQQVALFYLPESDKVFAVSQWDPFGHANVMSRGLVGSSGEDLYVASPLYKQRFRLEDGQCLDDESVKLTAWPTNIINGRVLIAA
jgi:nitrite reductase (NADH) small subunit